MKKIHSTAIIEKGAKIGLNVEIGSYSIIGPNVEIGDGTVIKSNVVIDGFTKIGKNNTIFPFAAIGLDPQDLKFRGEESELLIGDNNKIREYVTIHTGTKDGAMKTIVGSGNLFMIGVHIAHDCIIGNNVIFANNATLAGHVEVSDNVVIGGLSAIHQFVRIGKGAMIGGMSGVEFDVVPYGLVMGERAYLAGLNLVGLKRGNHEKEEINKLRSFFKQVFLENNNDNLNKKVLKAKKEYDQKLVLEVINFLESKTTRSFCKVKNA